MRPLWRWLLAAAGILVAAGTLLALTLPLWLRPILQTQISHAVGRPVTIGHLALAWTQPPRLIAEGVRVASPTDFPPDTPNWATIARVVAELDLRPLWRLDPPDIPAADVTSLQVTSVQLPDGRNNFTFILPPPVHGTMPRIGAIRLHDSHAQISLHAVGAELSVDLRTEGEDGNSIIGDLTGTYAGEAVHGRVTGGPILTLHDATAPYAVDIRLASGSFQIAIAGTVRDIFRLGGADLRLDAAGPDLAAIHKLTGLPFPPTPPYRLTSPLAYENGVIRLPALVGRLGSSDLAGSLDIDIRPDRPVLSGALVSNRVDLQDLAGFIGSQPGRPETPGLTPAQREAVARAIAHPRLIPTLKMDIPAIRAADVHLTYQAAGVIGRDMPFDSLSARLDLDDGSIRLTNLRAGMGQGAITGTIAMDPRANEMRTRAELRLQRLDVRRLMAAAGIFKGDGLLGGTITLDSTGRSLSEILANGTGRASFAMAGGSVSKLVVDLSGLQLGEAVLSALGLPERAQVNCLLGDFALARGALATRTFLLDTEDDRTTLQGSIDVASERINAVLRTRAKHFTIGSLATAILVTGTLKNPAFAPEGLELGARAASAVGLGLLLPAAAVLPTIQFGIGEDNACAAVAREAPRR